MPGGTGGFPGRSFQDGDFAQNKLSTKLRKYTYTTFSAQGRFTAPNGYGDPTGTAGDSNLGLVPAQVGGGLALEYFVMGTQTLLAPSFSASGLDISQDQTNNDGVQHVFGGLSARSKHAFTIGSEPAPFFAKLTFALSDVSGQDDCAFGFRKNAAFTANFDDYTDAAVLNMISGDIKIETILNNAATTTVDTTQDWADAASHSFEIEIGIDGTVRFFVDGAFPTVTKSNFVFDTGDVVLPTLFFLQDATSPGTCNLTLFECGYRIPRGQ